MSKLFALLAGFLLLAAAAVRAADPAPAAPAPAGKHLRVLAVGNSFSGNTGHYFADIVKASGNTVTFVNAYIGGCSLARHMRHADAHEANPDDKEGKPYNGKSLKELLLQDQWDVITIQQFSGDSYKPETYRPHGQRLADYIRKYAPKAEIVVHETWAYRADDPLFAKPEFSSADMSRGLHAAYAGIARDLGGLRVIPVGTAFETARLDPAWGPVVRDPEFDYAAAPAYPALPKEQRSLNVGYYWKKDKDGKQTRIYDGHHANVNGEYLGGAVWAEFLFGTSVVGNRFVPPKMDPQDAAILQRIAHEVVTVARAPAPAASTP